MINCHVTMRRKSGDKWFSIFLSHLLCYNWLLHQQIKEATAMEERRKFLEALVHTLKILFEVEKKKKSVQS